MYQKWRDLFFLHWKCDPKEIQKTLPKGLYVDTFDQNAYVGIVPFKIYGVRTNFLPPIPGMSHFLETNVRTYVYNDKNERGIWFYSLDANHFLAVRAARLFFKLPYFYSTIKLSEKELESNYVLKRKNFSRFHLKREKPLYRAEKNTLEHFLIERYQLFTVNSHGTILTLKVSHEPYDLTQAHLINLENTLFDADNLPISSQPFHFLYSPGVNVKIYGLKDSNNY